MERFLKQVLISILEPINVHPTVQTDKSDVKKLINKLRPICPDVDLIRLGPKGDGGYLVPDDLAGIEACFSPGVSEISGFERDCAELGMKVFLADKSVDGPATDHENFTFIKKYVGAFTSEDFIKIDDWVASSLPDSHEDLLLQIDIEGYEFENFLCISENLMRRFRIIVAEFHNLHMLWSKPYFRLASHTFEKILQTHSCVHIHPNNICGSWSKNDIEIPTLLEFTFARSDRLSKELFASKFPHPLDYDNVDKSPIILPECWYGKK